MYFADASRGWAVGYAGTILTTGDGGATLEAPDIEASHWLYSVHFANASLGWVVGEGSQPNRPEDDCPNPERKRLQQAAFRKSHTHQHSFQQDGDCEMKRAGDKSHL